MSDNFTFTPGTGETGAAKNVGGVLYPQVIATEIDGTDTGLSAKLGSLTETAPSTDTASSGHNGRLQRIAQNISSLIALLPAALTGSGNLKIAIEESSATVAISASALPLPSGAATSAKQPALGTAGSAATDVISVQGIASMTALKVDGSAVTQPTSIADGSNTTLGAKADAKNSATDTTAISAMSVWKQISASIQAVATSIAGTLTVTQSGTWNIGTVSTLPSIPAGSNNIGLVTITPGTAGGWSPSLQNGLSTTVETVKSSAGTLGGYYIYNPNSSVAYVQIFDASSVTLGSTTPKLSIGIPAGGAANIEFANGVNFATAIKVAATTTATGSTAPSTAVDCNFFYK